MKKNPRVPLLHIRDALNDISRYTEGGEQEFLRDRKTQDAVIYKLAVIGEAVKRLPKSLREKYPSVAWKSIAGLRDIVIHEYDLTEIPRIWNIVQKDVPSLKTAVRSILRDMPK